MHFRHRMPKRPETLSPDVCDKCDNSASPASDSCVCGVIIVAGFHRGLRGITEGLWYVVAPVTPYFVGWPITNREIQNLRVTRTYMYLV